MSFGPFSGSAPSSGWGSGSARACAPRGPRKALEIVGIVFLFFHFWPLAAAYIAWKLLGYPVPVEARAVYERAMGGLREFGSGGGLRPSGTGNLAFDEYRRGEIERLERERRRLDDEAQEFRTFVDDLKRAKDRTEFDAYMAQRRSGTTPS